MPQRMRNPERMRRIVQALAIRWLDPLFQGRHPVAVLLRIIAALGPLVRLLQPNDRWMLPAFVPLWAKSLKVPPHLPLPPAKRLLIFSCYRGQFTRDLVLAMLLAWRGHSVTLAYRPKLRSPIKAPLEDSAGAASYLGRSLGTLERLTRGRVRCCLLPAVAAGSVEGLDHAYLESQIRADVIMKVRREHYDPLDPEVAQVIARTRRLGEEAYAAALHFMRQHKDSFDLAVIANGASFENGYVCKAAQDLGLPVNTHEKFAFAKVLTMTHGAAFFHFSDLDLIWQMRARLDIFKSPHREWMVEKAWELLDQRRNSSGSAWGWQYQKDTRSRRVDEVLETLGVPDQGFVLVCPNVPFDAGYEGWLTLFPSMRDWLTQTLRHLLETSSLPVVVRAHPAEIREGFGEEKILTILEEAGLKDQRIVIVSGDSDINTYDLMGLCQFAVVFASTTGLEIAMHGKPVLAGANVYYARCDVSVPAQTVEAYFTALSGLAMGQCAYSQAENAAIVYFLFHYFLQWRFPYDKPSQISMCPPHRLLIQQNREVFIETLDSLAMTRDTFTEALPNLLTAAKLAVRWGWDIPETEPSRPVS